MHITIDDIISYHNNNIPVSVLKIFLDRYGEYVESPEQPNNKIINIFNENKKHYYQFTVDNNDNIAHYIKRGQVPVKSSTVIIVDLRQATLDYSYNETNLMDAIVATLHSFKHKGKITVSRDNGTGNFKSITF